MAVYTTIDNPELYHQSKLYAGDGNSTQAITLDGDENMQPDLVWLKNRSDDVWNVWTDSVQMKRLAVEIKHLMVFYLHLVVMVLLYLKVLLMLVCQINLQKIM